MVEQDWMKKYQEEQKAAGVVAKNRFEALIPQLKELKVAEIVVHYDGSGDSGQVEDVTCYSTIGHEYDFGEVKPDEVKIEEPLKESFDEIACDVLTGLDIDWYNNAGGFGDVVFDVATGKATVKHNTRFEDSTYEEHEV